MVWGQPTTSNYRKFDQNTEQQQCKHITEVYNAIQQLHITPQNETKTLTHSKVNGRNERQSICVVALLFGPLVAQQTNKVAISLCCVCVHVTIAKIGMRFMVCHATRHYN